MGFRRSGKEVGVASDATSGSDEGESGDQVDVPAAKQRRRKPDELLASIVNESVVGAAVDQLKANEPFALPGGDAWVVLLLPVNTEQFGGLGRKQTGDRAVREAKGSIVSAIEGGSIQVVATKPMLNKEVLGIIPTKETLGRMDEYTLLTSSSYYWGVMWLHDGDLEAKPSGRATYQEAVVIAEGKKDLANTLPKVWAWASGEAPVEQAPVAPPPPAGVDTSAHSSSGADLRATQELAVFVASESDQEPVPEPTAAEAIDVFASAPEEDPLGDAEEVDDSGGDAGATFEKVVDDGVDYAALAAEDEPSLEDRFADTFEAEASPVGAAPVGYSEDPDEVLDDGDNEHYADSDDHYDGEGVGDAYDDYVAEHRSSDFTEEDVRGSIARRFLSNDLDLSFGLEEFEAMFQTEAPAITIDVSEDPSDWLGSQVAQIVRQANASLRKLNSDNASSLRQAYIEMLSRHAETVRIEVSLERDGSVYRKMKEALHRDFELAKSSSSDDAAVERREITERFEKESQAREDQAAAHARVQFRDRNRPDLERRLAEVGVAVDTRNEDKFAHDQLQLLDLRRKDADVRMDLGMTRVLQVMSETHAELRAEETVLLESWTAEVSAFIDENRKSDIARMDALADELARSEQVAALRTEQQQHVEEINSAHADRVRRLEGEIARNAEQAQAILAERESEWRHDLSMRDERLRSSENLVTRLTAQIGELDEVHAERYRDRIQNLLTINESKEAEIGRNLRTTRALSRTTTLMLTILAIAAFLVGMLIGSAFLGN